MISLRRHIKEKFDKLDLVKPKYFYSLKASLEI